MSDELFYLRDSRSDVGSSAMFWMIDGGGYTSNLLKAHKYTREEAVKQYYSRETDIPVRCDLADEHSYFAVDCQLVDEENFNPVGDVDVVFQVPKCWDGNNIFFYSGRGGKSSVDYSLAFVAKNETPFVGMIPLDKSKVDVIARPVVKAGLIPTRYVLRKAKIKMNPRGRKKRETSGKTRHNCPCCGRILWDYNPYDAGRCRNIKCDRWRI